MPAWRVRTWRTNWPGSWPQASKRWRSGRGEDECHLVELTDGNLEFRPARGGGGEGRFVLHIGDQFQKRFERSQEALALARMAVARFTPTIQAQHAVFNQGGRGWVAVDDADTDERIFFQSWEAPGRAAGTLVLVCRACYLTLVVCGRAIRRRRR